MTDLGLSSRYIQFSDLKEHFCVINFWFFRFKVSWTVFFRIFESHFQIRYMAKTASYTNIRLFVTTLHTTAWSTYNREWTCLQQHDQHVYRSHEKRVWSSAIYWNHANIECSIKEHLYKMLWSIYVWIAGVDEATKVSCELFQIVLCSEFNKWVQKTFHV